jgi:RHH-type rel operon transcriptional repressor/antitoxin RelB
MFTLRLPRDVEQRIAQLAKRSGRSKASYVQEAIILYLDDLEDKYLALDRLEKPGKRWPLDDIEKDRDLGN